MSNYSTLKTAIQQAVYTNGNGEITGAGLQAVLLQIVNTVGDGYVFKGVATAGTAPGTPDANVFYIAPAGTYMNFGSTYTVPEGRIGIFMYNGSWSKSRIKISGGAGGGGGAQNYIPVNFVSNAKMSVSLKKIFYAEEKQAVIRNKYITDILVDCCGRGTFSILTADKADVTAMTASADDLSVTVVETFDIQHWGWNKLHLSTPLLIDGDTCLGFYDMSDTFLNGYCLNGTHGGCDFVAPYSGWYFGKTDVYDYDYKLNIGVITRESESEFHPIEESVVGGYSLGIDAEFGNSTPMYLYGGFFLREEVQDALRGETITHVRVNVTHTGILRVVVGTWTDEDGYAGAWFDTHETIVVRELGWHTYKLQRPIVLGADDWLGFNGDEEFTLLCTTNKINSCYNSQYGFRFWGLNGGNWELQSGYWCGFEAITENSAAVRGSEIYRETKLCGKKVVLIGDSISSYNGIIPAGYEYFYPQGDVNNWILTWWAKLGFMQSLRWVTDNGDGTYTYYNRSWSGSKVTNLQGGDKPYCSTARLSTLPAPDVILFFGGINDLAGGTPHPLLGDEPTWGTMGTMDLSEFRGAYAYCVEYLLTNYPDAKLICMTPTQISTLGHFTDNDMGVDFADITEAIKEICDKYGVSVIDMSRCGITYLNTDDYTLDGVHPNKAGMKMIADYVNEQINDIL